MGAMQMPRPLTTLPQPTSNSGRLGAIALILLVAVAGCGAPDPSEKEVRGVEEGPAAVEEIALGMVDQDGFAEEIAKHEGKIVVVDFWATWCEPCKERFPHMVELSHQFPREDVVFVSVSLDFAGQEEKVVEFLQEQNAHPMINLMTTLETTEAFDAYEIEDGIPHYKVFDRSGAKKYSFAQYANEKKGVLTTEMLDIKLHELLAK